MSENEPTPLSLSTPAPRTCAGLSTLVALALLLSSVPAEARRLYRIKIVSEPPKAAIYVKDKASGVRAQTPATLRMPRGKHTIILEFPGYRELSRAIYVKRSTTVEFRLQKIPEKSTVTVALVDESLSAGASLSVNGEAKGGLPATLQLEAGRHQFEVTRADYHPWKQWVELGAGEKRSLHVDLAAKAPQQGTLLVSSNAPGAEIVVDGKLVGGSPALVEGLSVGTHQVEVRAKGYTGQSRTVAVEQGKTARLTVDLTADKSAAAANQGTLQVLSEPRDADIYVDGVFRGKSPVKVEELAVGTHIVEAKLAGFAAQDQQVKVTAGQVSTVKVNLEKKDAAPAPAITAPAPPAPATAAPSAASPTTATVATTAAQATAAAPAAPLTPARAPNSAEGVLAVSGGPAGATVYVDGKPQGTLPLPNALVLKRGQHELKVTAPNHVPLVRFVEVGAKPLRVTALLKHVDGSTATAAAPAAAAAPATTASASSSSETTTAEAGDAEPVEDEEEEEEIDPRGLSSYGAQLVPPRFFTGDISFGYPYMVEGRLTTGVFSWGHFGLDAGVELRTFGVFTDFGVDAKFRVFHFEPFAAAVWLAVGGGLGPGSRDTFYFNSGLSLSLSFKRLLTFTARFWLNYYSDKHCPGSPSDGEDDLCTAPPANLERNQDVRGRFSRARFIMSAILEVPITTHIGTFALVEGAPGQAQRLAFTDPFFSYFAADDPRIYGRLGLSFKF